MSKATFKELFGVEKPLFGVIKLDPLPGAPRYSGNMKQILDRALSEARIFEESGVDALIIENYGDYPFFAETQEPETVASMTVVSHEVAKATRLPIGVNVLRNSWKAALAIAATVGGSFIRLNILTDVLVTDQGLISGAAAEAARYKRFLGCQDIKIFSDIYSKHGAPLARRPLAVVAEDMVHRGGADAIIVDGVDSATPPPLEDIEEVKQVVPETPVLIGSGLKMTNAELLHHADGAIIGYGWMGHGMRRTPDMTDAVLLERMREFVQALNAVRVLRGERVPMARTPKDQGAAPLR